jgi:hypothetical protein
MALAQETTASKPIEQSPDGFTRRSFIYKGMEAVACAMFGALSLEGKANPLHVFIEESGVFGGFGPFCIGAILAKEPEVHLSHIRQLRLRHHYRSRLLYRSTDKFKRDFAGSVVSYFFRAPDLRFIARVINKKNTNRESSRAAQEATYQQHYRKLILESAPRGYPLSLTLVNHSLGGADGFLRAYLHDEIPGLISIQVARLRQNDLLQLANLFAGSVSEGDVLTNKVKLAPIRQLELSLGVGTLKAPLLWRKSKFKVRVV